MYSFEPRGLCTLNFSMRVEGLGTGYAAMADEEVESGLKCYSKDLDSKLNQQNDLDSECY